MHEITKCYVVQMEHCWFLRALKNIMCPRFFSRLYVTHIEIVSDIVPKHDNIGQHFWEICHGVDYSFLRNQQNIGTIKSDFLELWLKMGVLRMIHRFVFKAQASQVKVMGVGGNSSLIKIIRK